MTPSLISHNGQSLTHRELAKLHGLSLACLRTRLYKLGWPIQKALETKVHRPTLPENGQMIGKSPDGQLRIIKAASLRKDGQSPEIWVRLECYCGKRFVTKHKSVMVGNTMSCGCLRIKLCREKASKRKLNH